MAKKEPRNLVIPEDDLRTLLALLNEAIHPTIVYQHKDERAMADDAWTTSHWKSLAARQIVLDTFKKNETCSIAELA